MCSRFLFLVYNRSNFKENVVDCYKYADISILIKVFNEK